MHVTTFFVSHFSCIELDHNHFHVDMSKYQTLLKQIDVHLLQIFVRITPFL